MGAIKIKTLFKAGSIPATRHKPKLIKMENLKLWNKVEKTNPSYTKKANVRGNNITSIAPQFQIKSATEQFGVYGKAWGFKSVAFDYTLKEFGMVVFNATFFFPEGEFPISNAISFYRDNARTKIDSDFAKKVETDTLTKALSKLGFNADIFLGKFDDIRYVEDMKEEFKAGEQKENDERVIDAMLKAENCTTVDELNALWDENRGLWKVKEFINKVKEIKTKLS